MGEDIVGGMGGEGKALKAGIQMVTSPHTPVPFSPTLEDLYLPSAEKIASAVRKTMAN